MYQKGRPRRGFPAAGAVLFNTVVYFDTFAGARYAPCYKRGLFYGVAPHARAGVVGGHFGPQPCTDPIKSSKWPLEMPGQIHAGQGGEWIENH